MQCAGVADNWRQGEASASSSPNAQDANRLCEALFRQSSMTATICSLTVSAVGEHARMELMDSDILACLMC